MELDVIIIGGGPAGLSAAIYSSRAMLKTLLIEKAGCGGHLVVTDNIENYPGFDKGVNGFDLASMMDAQAKSFGAAIVIDEIKKIENGKIKKVFTQHNVYSAKTLIIAAGTQIRELNISGESQFLSKGVSYCAVCDGLFFKNKTVAVIGGGDSAAEESLYLSKIVKEVKIIYRGNKLRAVKILQEKISKTPNISVTFDSVPIEIKGGQTVESLIIENVKTKQKTELSVSAVFVFIGLIANTGLFNFVELDKDGYIITDENMKTSSEGVFACGDIRKKTLRQIVTAVSDGAQAAMSAQKFIEDN
jgi:thioredoxin reductase (NADPH)